MQLSNQKTTHEVNAVLASMFPISPAYPQPNNFSASSLPEKPFVNVKLVSVTLQGNEADFIEHARVGDGECSCQDAGRV
ncbi:MAG: hypothetical protein H0T92_10880 [Pyrinomonadaceae bacterium]|nr:hypothetical protein [Pyrinomonadaceae bacterium]